MLIGGGGLPPAVSQKAPSTSQGNIAEKQGGNLAVTPGQVIPGDTQMVQAVEHFSQPGELFNYRYQFKVNSATKQVVIQVVDKKTGKELFEIPPKEIIHMMAAIDKELNQGHLVDQKI